METMRSNDKNFAWRGFLTPQPPAWKNTKTPILPMSEKKRVSPAASHGDCFHVIHKVPASDSPYGRAKHVQLIEKDPSRSISLFWAAINAGDRVDSALKDMAVVMKQLDRPDEAIEAIKSFRHLCPPDAQESLDNVLIELYKRSGRVEEEIVILQKKLRNIEEGTIFGGKKTKIARSQGKKIQITIEQEKSRILGNLAWAHLQQHNYGMAEQHYRNALSLEPDRNKQCNLAICLMHMNRISEAKSLLQDVKASSGNKQMDESYSKSYERALEMLTKFESQPSLEPVTQEGRDMGTSLAPFRDISLKAASMTLPRNEDNISGFIMNQRSFPYACRERKMLSDEQISGSYCRSYLEENDNFSGFDDRSSICTPIGPKGNVHSSPQTTFTEKWSRGSYVESPCEGSLYSSKLKENWGCRGQEVDSAHKKTYAFSADSTNNSEALFTQPRRCSWGFNNANLRKGGRRVEDKFLSSSRKLSFEKTLTSETVPSRSIQNLDVESQTPSNGKSENPATGQSEGEVQESRSGVILTQPRNSLLWLNNGDQRRARWVEESVGISSRRLSFEKTTTGLNSHSAKNLTGEPLVSPEDNSEMGLEKPIYTPSKKSWADMVEEEEKEELQSGRKHPGKSYREEEFNDENLNSNIIYPDSKDHAENITQQLQSFDIESGSNASVNTVSSRRNRLQVFRDITSP